MVFGQQTAVHKYCNIAQVMVSGNSVPEKGVLLTTDVGKIGNTLVAWHTFTVEHQGHIVKPLQLVCVSAQERKCIVGLIANRNHDIYSR